KGALLANGSLVLTPVGNTEKNRPSAPKTISTWQGGRSGSSPSDRSRSARVSSIASSGNDLRSERTIRHLESPDPLSCIQVEFETGPGPESCQVIVVSRILSWRKFLKNSNDT